MCRFTPNCQSTNIENTKGVGDLLKRGALLKNANLIKISSFVHFYEIEQPKVLLKVSQPPCKAVRILLNTVSFYKTL